MFAQILKPAKVVSSSVNLATRFLQKYSLLIFTIVSVAAVAYFASIQEKPDEWIEKNFVNLLTIIGVLVGVWSLRLNSWISLRNQRISVRIAIIERYDEFSKTRNDLPDFSSQNELDRKKILSYFRSHWAIKKDQIDFWLAGYVDPEALVGWLMSDVGYFSNRSKLIKAVDFTRYWEQVRDTPGSVDARVITLIERIRNDIVDLNCTRAACSRPSQTCPTFQRAGLFWLLNELETEEHWFIRSREAHGIGRETFEALQAKSPIELRRRIKDAGNAIKAKRLARGSVINSPLPESNT